MSLNPPSALRRASTPITTPAFTEGDLALLQGIADGEWDLTTRLQARSEEAETVNRILENLAETLTVALRCGVRLYGNVPPLFDFSSQLEGAAKTQEERAAQIAGSAREMAGQIRAISGRLQEALVSTASVAGIMADLDSRSKQIEKVVDRVQRVAGQTKLLSLNASVEAARAGQAGRAFAVVAQEVQKLAADAADATSQIRDVLHDLEARIHSAVLAVGKGGDGGTEQAKAHDSAAANEGANALSLTGLMEGIVERVKAQSEEVSHVVEDIASIAGEARLQTEGAAKLKEMANRAREGSDALIVSLGAFQLPTHARPRDIVARLAQEPAIRSMDRRQQEEAMALAAERNRFIELLYITDTRGRQITANIAKKSHIGSSTGYGSDWSQREWFRQPMLRQAITLSDIYRSSASDRFCFTVSVPILALDENGEGEAVITGILAVDIDLTQLI